MSEPSSAPTTSPGRWFVVLAIAVLQNAIAVFAVYSSSRDVLSDGACIGGVYGSLANMMLLGVVLLWAMVLAVKSIRGKYWHPDLGPLVAVACSTVVAIIIGMNAALRCTV